MLRSEPLPERQHGAALVARVASAALRPPARMLVSEAAEKYRYLVKPGRPKTRWRNATTPYLVEIMDAATRRDTGRIVICGPSQFGKTEVFLNVCAWAIKVNPADILFLIPDKVLAVDFGERRIDRDLMEASADLKAELGPTRSDDKQLDKSFRNGVKLTLIWPVKGQLASRTVKIVMIDERDRLDDNIGGEGDPVGLLERRLTFFGKDGKALVASSPSRTDGTGIVGLWRDGDRRLLAVPCRECGDYWTPGFDEDRKPTLAHLYRPEGADTETARLHARLVCPSCGGLHSERDKAALLAAGVWVPAGQTVDRSGNLVGPPPGGRTRSYWFHGLLNPFVTLGDLAAELTAAERKLEEGGEEIPLRTVVNTVLGVNYRSAADGAEPLKADDFENRRGDYMARTVPDGARYLTATVDVQGNRFAVLVKGVGVDGQSWSIDRFDITSPGGREGDIQPGKRREDWLELLPRVMRLHYPLASDPAKALPIAVTAIDTGGEDGVTANARWFWHEAIKAGVQRFALMLIKGGKNKSDPMVGRPVFELVDGKPNKRGYHHWMLNVHELKNTLFNRLNRPEVGPGSLHWPAQWDKRWFEELTAEEKRGGIWDKIRRANETWDLEVYALAVSLRLGEERIDWNTPPAWARPVVINTARAKGGEGAGKVPAAGGASASSAPPAAVASVQPPPAPGRVRRQRGVRGRVQ